MNNKRENNKTEEAIIQFEEDLVAEVKADFKRRQEKRKKIERQWQLNMNFLMGNQYCALTDLGEIEDFSKQYFWQEREVYNHIAPLIDARLCKLSRVRPSMSVIPASNTEEDIATAKVSKKILEAVQHNLNISSKITSMCNWSEITGTAFFKVTWNSNKGTTVGIDANGQNIKSGEIDVTVCPPFEIFPDNNSTEEIDDCLSIIHAKPYNVNTIKKLWGVDVEPENLDILTLDTAGIAGGLGYTASVPKVIGEKVENNALVIERYDAPTVEFPKGRIIIVAGNKLLHVSDLPFVNREETKRGFPFIKQCSLVQPSSFWGSSIIERLIPIQRAYNAIKNRKHEFLNRLAMGILTVEDGSLDVENLAEEGLSPGKVLIYRQGSTPPKIMDYSVMPESFDEEENKLLSEFVQISGISDILIHNSIKASNLSGVTLELLLEQENNRMSNTLDQVKYALMELGKQILRLYKQFVSENRLSKIELNNGEIELFYWNASDISSDDVVLETANEMGESLAQKRNMIFELLRVGLLSNENGTMNARMRNKTLEMLGFGRWEDTNDLTELHRRKAGKENLIFIREQNRKVEVLEIDNHELHIDEHIAFMLSKEYEKEVQQKPEIKISMLNHIREHKQMLSNQI